MDVLIEWILPVLNRWYHRYVSPKDCSFDVCSSPLPPRLPSLYQLQHLDKSDNLLQTQNTVLQSCSLAVFRLADTIRNMQATGQSGNRWESGHEFISWKNWAEVSSWTSHRLVWQEARYPPYGGQWWEPERRWKWVARGAGGPCTSDSRRDILFMVHGKAACRPLGMQGASGLRHNPGHQQVVAMASPPCNFTRLNSNSTRLIPGAGAQQAAGAAQRAASAAAAAAELAEASRNRAMRHRKRYCLIVWGGSDEWWWVECLAPAHRKEGFAEPQLPELRPVEQGWWKTYRQTDNGINSCM